jgi:hypothetical protein
MPTAAELLATQKGYASELTAYLLAPKPAPAPAPPSGGGSTSYGGFGGQASREQLETVAVPAAVRQQQIAGDRELIGLVYGAVRLGAKIVSAVDYQGDLLLLAAFAYGPNSGLDQFYVGNDPIPATVTITVYLGTATQTVNATLQAAFALKGVTYTDALPYVTYAVLRFPVGSTSGFPQISARVTGRKVYDDRNGAQSFADPTTWAYSNNPALCLADFIRGPWGMNTGAGGIEPASVIAAANANDVALLSLPRRTINLALDRQQAARQWIAALRTYANVWVEPVGNNGEDYRFIVDQDGPTVMAFGNDDLKQDSLVLRKQSLANTPTVVEVIYTDMTIIPYRDGSAFAPADGQPAGGRAYRLSQVRVPGINNYAEAYRMALERLNDFTLCDLAGEFSAFDQAAVCEIGDLIEITNPIGLSAKRCRIVKPILASAGRYRIQFREFDPAKYSTVVATGPTYPDTILTPPGIPGPPTALVLAEEVYQVEAYGGYASRIHATWTKPDFLWLGGYQVDVTDPYGKVVWTSFVQATPTPSFRSGALQEGVTYQVSVSSVSLYGGTTSGSALTGSLFMYGKLLPPGDVAELSGFEAGGKVHLWWTQAIDIDIALYEIRYGSTAGSWDTATTIERINALTYVAQTVPPGLWRFYVKAVDSVGSYSPNPAIKDINVTIDASSFLVSQYFFTAPTVVSMTQWFNRPDPVIKWTSDFGDGIGYGADNPDNNIGTFGDSLASTPFATPHSTGTSPGTSSWTSETWDVGIPVSGTWQAQFDEVQVHAGTVSFFIDISTSASTGPFTRTTGISALANGRWARIGAYSTGAFTLSGAASLAVNVTPRREFGILSTVSSGPVTVNLANRYFLAKSIQVTGQGTTVVNPVYDNVVVGTGVANSFDIYAFNQAGTQMAASCSWIFEGVS